MTLRDIMYLEIGDKYLIRDDTQISVTKPYISYGAQLRRKGNWYQDHILDLMEEKISNFEFDAEENFLVAVLEGERGKG